MTLNYSNHETNQNYKKDNVVAITFTAGTMVIVLKDAKGNPYTLTYTKESMENGVISIF